MRVFQVINSVFTSNSYILREATTVPFDGTN